MNRQFSIFDTLAETTWLAGQHARVILVFALMTALLTSASEAAQMFYPKPQHTTYDSHADIEVGLQNMQKDISAQQRYLFITANFSLFMYGVELVLKALATASLLAVLKPNLTGISPWRAMNESVRHYTWRLVAVSLLITLIAIAILLPFEFLILGVRLTDASGLAAFLDFIVLLIAAIYLILIKYALAYPLVVVENRRAFAALRQSWKMTRGRFAYVLGCYIFVGLAEFSLRRGFQHLQIAHQFNWANFAEELIGGIFGCFWIVLAWVMYLRIKAAEEPTKEV